MSRFTGRLRRLEEDFARDDLLRVTALFLDIPEGKPAVVWMETGEHAICEDVAAVLAQPGPLKVYAGIDPERI